jgi:hypothetical protein
MLFIKHIGYTQLPRYSEWQCGLSPTQGWECGLSLTNYHFSSNWRHKQFAYPHVGLHQHSDGINSSNLYDQVFATLSGLHITCTASSSVKPNSYFPPLVVGIHLPPVTSLYLNIVGIPTKKLPQWQKIRSLSTYDWSGGLLSWITSTNNELQTNKVLENPSLHFWWGGVPLSSLRLSLIYFNLARCATWLL